MSDKRTDIMKALLAVLATSTDFKTTARRLKKLDNVSAQDCPALYLTSFPGEKYDRPQRGGPAIRVMNATAVIVLHAGDDPLVVPEDALNELMGTIEGLMVPDAQGQNERMTLGGLCYDCRIEGEIAKAPGDLDGKGLLVVPFVIVIP